jgi:hypothetical protein
VSGIYGAMQAIGALIAGGTAGLLYTRNITLPFWAMGATDLVMLVLIVVGSRAKWRGFGRVGSERLP